MSNWHRPPSSQPEQLKDLVPPQAPPPLPPPPHWRIWLLPLGAAITVLLLVNLTHKGTSPRTFTYTTFVKEVTANKVSAATVTSTGSVSGTLHGGRTYTSQIPTALDNNALSPLLLSHKVQVTGTTPNSVSIGTVILDLLPFLGLIGIFIWIGLRSKKQLGGIMGIGKSKAKLYDEERPKTRLLILPATKDPKPKSWRWWTS